MESKSLKASNSKSSKDEHTNDNDSCDEEDSDDELMGLFMRRYNRYIWKNNVKHSDNNLVKFRIQSTPYKEEYNKKDKGKGICYV